LLQVSCRFVGLFLQFFFEQFVIGKGIDVFAVLEKIFTGNVYRIVLQVRFNRFSCICKQFFYMSGLCKQGGPCVKAETVFFKHG